MTSKQKTFWDKCVRDQQGNRVLGQKPNRFQIIGWVALLLSWPLNGTAGHVAALVSVVAWLIWALLELFAGVNYFRRALGVIVLVLCLLLVLH